MYNKQQVKPRALPVTLTLRMQGGCTWRCGEERLVLFSTSLLRLSALECEVLQKLALPRLQQMDLGVQLQFPKGWQTNTSDLTGDI